MNDWEREHCRKEKGQSDGMAGEEERTNVFPPASTLVADDSRNVFMATLSCRSDLSDIVLLCFFAVIRYRSDLLDLSSVLYTVLTKVCGHLTITPILYVGLFSQTVAPK